MKRLICVLLLTASVASADKFERWKATYLANGGTNNPARVIVVTADGVGNETVNYQGEIVLPPIMSKAEATAYLATSDTVRIEGIASDPNTIKEIRQALKVSKSTLTNVFNNVNTNSAFTNPQQKILKDIIRELQENTRQDLKLLRDE